MGGVGGSGAKQEEKPAKGFGWDERALAGAANQMGEGVKFVSVKKMENETDIGYVAVYAFSDINNLKLDQNPTPAAMRSPQGLGAKKTEPIIFNFSKGNLAELTVKMPALDFKPSAKNERPAESGGTAMPMVQKMFKDMKITIAVEMAGAIKETNAQYRAGSRVTLMEMDFNKLLATPEKLNQLAKEHPKTVEEIMALMKGIEGIKVETTPELKIKLQ